MVSRIAPMLRDFMQKESAGGITLIFAAFAALIIANSPLLGAYKAWLDIPIVAGFGGFVIDKPLLLWVNDGLMAVFFFLIGLEVKREVLDGQLSSWNKASLPLVAAIGGMAIPALVFLGINAGSPENTAGWAIPAATMPPPGTMPDSLWWTNWPTVTDWLSRWLGCCCYRLRHRCPKSPRRSQQPSSKVRHWC